MKNYKNYGLLLEEILCLNHKVKDLNGAVSVTIMVKLVTNGILLASVVCGLEEKIHDEVIDVVPITALLLFAFTQIIDQAVSCYSSQMIINNMDQLSQQIREMTAKHCTEMLQVTSLPYTSPNSVNQQRNIEEVEYRCLQHICATGNSMCYSVLNMFDLRSLTVLITLSNVCNYAVLLIQTK